VGTKQDGPGKGEGKEGKRKCFNLFKKQLNK
jgi:hypothetical protein